MSSIPAGTIGRAIPTGPLAAAPAGAGSAARRRRMLLVLLGVWLLACFDLGFTIAAHLLGNFTELNPLASGLLGKPWYYLAAFKVVGTGTGTLILLLLWRHLIAELGTWLLLAAYVFVAARWYQYYAFMIEDSSVVCYRAW